MLPVCGCVRPAAATDSESRRQLRLCNCATAAACLGQQCHERARTCCGTAWLEVHAAAWFGMCHGLHAQLRNSCGGVLLLYGRVTRHQMKHNHRRTPGPHVTHTRLQRASTTLTPLLQPSNALNRHAAHAGSCQACGSAGNQPTTCRPAAATRRPIQPAGCTPDHRRSHNCPRHRAQKRREGTSMRVGTGCVSGVAAASSRHILMVLSASHVTRRLPLMS